MEGRFSTFRFTQVFSALWFGFPTVVGLCMLTTVRVPLTIAGFLALGVGMVAVAQHLSREEQTHILRALQRL